MRFRAIALAIFSIQYGQCGEFTGSPVKLCVLVVIGFRNREHRGIHRYRSYVTVRIALGKADSEGEATRQFCVLRVSA